jgi:carbamoyltransferase
MAQNIIGISAHYHDAACCLLRDGELAAAAQEERFSRMKNDSGIPKQALRYCLAQAGLTIADVDCVAYYEDPAKKLGRQIWMRMNEALSADRRMRLTRRLGTRSPLEDIREVLGYEGPLEVVDHHHAHAASAYYFSGFEDAAVLTVDGVGEWATTTYGEGRGAQLEAFEEVHFPHSLGLLYSTLTAYLGFEVNEGEYKVMGLAPYGEPAFVDQIRRLVATGPQGQFELDLTFFDFLAKDRMYSDALVELLKRPARAPESEIKQFHRDVAKSLQVVLEEVLLEKISHLHRRVPSDNLCLAGGVALNCVANARIRRQGLFKRLFIQPAAGDAGGALGAAMVAQIRRAGEYPRKALKHAYWGPAFSNDDVLAHLRGANVRFSDFRGDISELVRATAQRLAAGKIIGWFQGRMEFGPRSLGARSILADPRLPAMRDRINALVKQRESFRPFAPVVLSAKSSAHFDIQHDSPFMLETCQVNSSIDLPAITHVDGSARLQTIDAGANARLAALLEEFERQTGCPILLNTSFNVRGEPIVCTPEDAFLCFVRANLDALVIEDFILDKADVPAIWSMASTHVGRNASNIRHDVYTFV